MRRANYVVASNTIFQRRSIAGCTPLPRRGRRIDYSFGNYKIFYTIVLKDLYGISNYGGLDKLATAYNINTGNKHALVLRSRL
jgi:hypothetical protein